MAGARRDTSRSTAFTKAELAAITAYAKQERRTVSDVIRLAVLKAVEEAGIPVPNDD